MCSHAENYKKTLASIKKTPELLDISLYKTTLEEKSVAVTRCVQHIKVQRFRVSFETQLQNHKTAELFVLSRLKRYLI